VSWPEISEQLRAALDEIPVGKLAEYFAERLELDDGEQLLQLLFRDGRFQRMTRFAAIRNPSR